MAKKKNPELTPLEKLTQAADAAVLGELVKRLANSRPDLLRESLEFLGQHVELTDDAKADADAAALLAIWDELEPDLADLNEFGGGPREKEENVGNLLYELAQRLEQVRISRDARWGLLDDVMPYIITNNAGMEDALYDLAYACCQDDEDSRGLANLMEASGKDYLVDHAMRIYRKVGDKDKYLQLRTQRMKYGGDYHDLATFHWEHGEGERALAVAREGMQKGTGRMDELRAFLAERATETGDREGYLALQFAQATDRLTLASYQAFQKLCTAEEWTAYEPRMLAVVAKLHPEGRLEIHMERQEYDQAIRLLSGMRFPDRSYYGGDRIVKIAAQLEDRFPRQLLAFYKSGLGNLKQLAPRENYALKADLASKIRRLWVDVLKEPARWQAFARPIKIANLKRPAFQAEFARKIPGWAEL